MDQVPKKEGRAARWDNPFPIERNSQSQSDSGRDVDHETSLQSHYLKPSHLNLLASFGLSSEDLEELSHYPDNQLTPENMPLLLQAIQKRKLALKVPTLPSKIRENEEVPNADGRGPTVKKEVIDYGHKSKYEYNEGPVEVNASSTAMAESTKGSQAQQPASVPAAPSTLISNPKNPTKELVQRVGSQTSTPNLQASPPVDSATKVPLTKRGVPATVAPVKPPTAPPMPQPAMPPVAPPILMPAVTQRPPPFAPELCEVLSRRGKYEHPSTAHLSNSLCQTMDGQKSSWKEAEEPFKSPFGVVKASWLPVFPQTDKQKAKNLPTPSEMNDYRAVTPRVFPHICSLCHENCTDKEDWILHQNSLQHSKNCHRLLQQHPDWTPESPSSPQRHEGDRQERHESRRRSASPSPKRSRHASSGHARHRTRSRSRSCGRHRTSQPRSRSPRRLPSPRHRSRSPRRALPSSRRSRSSSRKENTRSRSRSCEHHRTSRPRSRSPRRLPSPKQRSRSPRQSLQSSRWSRNSSSKERTRSRSRSCERHRRSQPRSRSPRHLPSPRHRSRSPQQSLRSSRWSRSSSSKERTRSRSRSCGRQRRSQSRSQSPRHLPSPRHLSRSPQQSLQSSGRSWSSSSKERGSGSSTRSSGAADRTLNRGRNSAQLAATVTSTSSDLVSMIQQVATQVITAVLDSKEASAMQASSSVRDPTPRQVNSVTRKAKNQREISAALPPRTSANSKTTTKSVVGPRPQQSRAKRTKVEHQGSPCPKKGTSLSGKTKNKHKAGLCPKKSRSLCKKAKNQHAESPCVQQGSAANAEEDKNQDVVDQRPHQGIALADKAADDSMVALSPQQGTAVSGKSENQAVASCSLAEGTAGNQEAESLHVADPIPNQGSAGSGETEEKCPGGPSSQEGLGPNSKVGSQVTELELVPGGVCPCSGTPGGVPKPRVRICGDSVVVPAQKQASSTMVGSQLGLEEWIVLEWHGQENMTWKELLPAIQNLAAQGQTPDVVVIHLQGEDLVHAMELGLLSTVKRALFLLRGLLPPVKVIWSEMIPQGIWHGAERREQRKKLNTAVGETIESFGGAVIRHPRISSEDPELYTDEADLSEAGLDVFLDDIKNGILAQVLQSRRAANGGIDQGLILPPPVSLAAPTGLGSVSQEAATQGDEVVSSSKEASSVRTNTGEAAVSSQPVSSKAEASGVASPSPRPGTSGTQKAKKLKAGQKKVAASVPSCSGPAGHLSKPRVWICGPSVVAAAQIRASATGLGSQLGLEKSIVLEWHGQQDLKWDQLLPFLQKLTTQSPPPDALIIHLADDDLAHAWEYGLLVEVKRQFGLLTKCLPTVKVFWSEMIPWGGDRDCRRAKVNRFLGNGVKLCGGDVIKHARMSSEAPELECHKASVSNAALDTFLEDIKSEILAHMCQPRRTMNGRLKKDRRFPPPASPTAPAGLDSVTQKGATQEDEEVSSSWEATSMQVNTGEAAVSSQPASSKAETSGVARPSPRPGRSRACKAKKRDVGRKLVLGSVPPCPGEAAVSSQPVSCKTKTFGVASPSRQPHTSGTRKAKKLDVERKLVQVRSLPPLLGAAGHPSKPRIWICGHSVIAAAEERAATTSIGYQLGLEEWIVLEWHGWNGMKWVHLIPFLQDLAACHSPPDVLIVHLRESELRSTQNIHFLIQDLKTKLFLIEELFPHVKVVWSDMIVWGNWPKKSLELLRKLNFHVGNYIKGLGGAVINHRNPCISEKFLSAGGLDIFLKEIRDGILAHLRQSNRAPGVWPKKSMRVSPAASPAGQSSHAVSWRLCRSPRSLPLAVPAGLSSVSQEVATREDEAVSSSKEASCQQSRAKDFIFHRPGEAAVGSQPASCKGEASGVANPSPQPGTSGDCKAKKRNVEQKLALRCIPPCPGEAAVSSQPVSSRARTSGVASPCPQPARSRTCKAKKLDIEQKLVHVGSVAPSPGAAAVSSQPVGRKSKASDVVNPSPKPGASGACKAENPDVEQELVDGSIPPCSGTREGVMNTVGSSVPGSVPPCPGEAAVSSQPESIKAEASGVASPSPQPGTSGICKAKKRDVEQKLVQVGSVPPCPGAAAVSSQPVSRKAETSGAASPSPEPGASGACKAENPDVEQELVAGSIPPCSGEAAVSSQPASGKAEASGVASPRPQPRRSRACKAKKRDVGKKLVLGSVPPCPGEAAVSSQPASGKAEASGVASSSLEPGASGTCKAENPDVEQKLVAGSVPPCSGNPERAPKQHVWICGQSVVVSAEKQASGTGAGSQLGLEESIHLEWHGQEDLTWAQLVPTLQTLAAQGQAPDVLVVHLGENDLEGTRGAQLSCAIKKELVLVKELFPQVRILWSNMLLRRRGAGKAGSRTVNRARTMVNLEMGPFLATLGGAVIEHPAVLHTDPDFYVDGDSLSCRGLEVFLEDIKNGILAHLHSR